MFPSVPQNLVLEGVRKALESSTTQKPFTANLVECFKICLTENHFEVSLQKFTEPPSAQNGVRVGLFRNGCSRG